MRVPKDLRARVNKTEVTRTLETKDPVEAVSRHRKVAAEIEAQWAGFRRGEQTLTVKQRYAIAGEMYREMVAAGKTNPGDAKAIEAMLASDRDALQKRAQALGGSQAQVRRQGLGFYAKFNPRMMEFLERKGIVLSSREQASLLSAFAEAVTQANEQLLKNAKGDFSADPKADQFAEYVPPEKEAAASKSLTALYDLNIGQLDHSDGTIRRWRPKYAQFEEFIAPKAWHQATKQDVIAWKDKLLTPKKFPDRQPVKPVTVRDVHFSARLNFRSGSGSRLSARAFEAKSLSSIPGAREMRTRAFRTFSAVNMTSGGAKSRIRRLRHRSR